MSDAAPKAQRWWIVIPWAIFIIGALGWTAWWTIAAHQIAVRMDAGAQGLRQGGYTVAWGKRSISGYPFRFFIQLSDANIHEPQGWGVSSPQIQAETSALTPGVIVFVAPQGLVLARPGLPALAVTGQALRMSLGGLDGLLPRVAIQGVDLRLAPPAGDVVAFSAIKTFEAHLRPAAGDTASVDFRIDTATPTAGTVLARIAAGRPVTVDVEGVLSHASSFRGSDLESLLSRWSAAGGQLNLTQGGLATGDAALVSLKPAAIAVDPQGYAQGALSLSMQRVGDAIIALSGVAVLSPQTAAVASGLVGAGGFDATLQFHDGQTWLGPVPLGEAPRIFQPREQPGAD